ncbi:hypothetical protein HGA13_30795 [Nocardia speluncae]|uniref:ADP ribosyltransferase domain-containing protein n=1 Tax=Nocardia speluncae TaxID=419477 RepID=A0A846XSF5_9NOCA|nr:ADP-ribosyltransferase [Nocardia speluncae]NKY37423.1 hypothetical protein [Nocardia speluncae]
MYSRLATAMRALADKLDDNVAALGTARSDCYRNITSVPIGHLLRTAPGADGAGAASVADEIRAAAAQSRAAAISTPRPPLSFPTQKLADDYGNSVWGPFYDRLDHAQRESLRDYWLGSEGINAPLRGDATYPPNWERVGRLDRILNLQPVPARLEAWKTIRFDRLFPECLPSDVQPGRRGHFADFVSTSLTRGGIETLGRTRGRDTDLRIEVPPGTPGFFIGEKSAWSWESELLLGRDLGFELLEWDSSAGRWAGAIRILAPDVAAPGSVK